MEKDTPGDIWIPAVLVFTHEMASEALAEQIKQASKPDFVSIKVS